MRDIDDVRRANLKLLEIEAGSTTAAAAAAGMSVAQFSNLRDGAKDSKTGKPRGMRKTTARKIEEGHGKPAGWLDTDHEIQSIDDGQDTEKTLAVMRSWRLKASPRSQRVIDQLMLQAQLGTLGEDDWKLIEQVVQRLKKQT